MKKCSNCKETKQLNNFNNSKLGKFGVHHYCKVCHSEYRKQKYIYNKSKSKYAQIKFKYNITELELNKMFIAQDKKCMICKKQYSSASRQGGLYIDHCHRTGKVRALLCSNCNTGLGMFKDNINILESSIAYLKQYE
tara:strand:- start:32 stop:442 length:411 start_codon:yes stop_codon:yes gene_type:complete